MEAFTTLRKSARETRQGHCLRAKRIRGQLDEIWSFVGMKEKSRVAGNHSLDVGDSWTFIAIERETKLILAHQVGQRDGATCGEFLSKFRRCHNRPVPVDNGWNELKSSAVIAHEYRRWPPRFAPRKHRISTGC
jgi:hypothetical protein